jgi:hypothetical protein
MIDFECYFDDTYTLDTKKKTGQTYPCYIADERFELFGAGVSWSECDGRHWEPPVFIWAEQLPEFMEYLVGECGLDNITFVAQNGMFDFMIMKLKFGVVPKYTIDTADLTRYYDARMSHRLADVALMVGDKPKGKTVQFKGLHLADILSDPEKTTALIEYTKTDIELQCNVYDWFLPHMDVPHEELNLARLTHDMYLNCRFEFDDALAVELLRNSETQMKEDMGDYTGAMLRSPIQFASRLRSMLPPWEVLPTKSGKPGAKLAAITGKGRILAVSKQDQGLKQMMVHPVRCVRDLMRAKSAAGSWPTHMKRFETLRAQAKAFGGMIWVPLLFCGAHTHRWSGTQGINPQNMAKLGKTGKSKVLGLVRHLFRAPAGEELIICDSAQIEARGLAWMAGEIGLLKQFAAGGDVYSDFASDLFQSKVFKWYDQEEEYPGHKDKVKGQRDFGKVGILAGGYGMGNVTLYDRCMTNDELLPRFESGEYSAGTCADVIDTYRAKFKNIVGFWTKVERSFVRAFRYKETVKRLIPGTIQCLEFIGAGSTVFIKLPSGRRIRYSKVAIAYDGEITCRGSNGERSKLYGGKLTENIIQSFCRDLICYWILRCDEESLPVLLTVHDEIVSIALKGIPALVALMRVTNIMCEVPDWARGMPVDTEGCICQHYKK